MAAACGAHFIYFTECSIAQCSFPQKHFSDMYIIIPAWVFRQYSHRLWSLSSRTRPKPVSLSKSLRRLFPSNGTYKTNLYFNANARIAICGWVIIINFTLPIIHLIFLPTFYYYQLVNLTLFSVNFTHKKKLR